MKKLVVGLLVLVLVFAGLLGAPSVRAQDDDDDNGPTFATVISVEVQSA